MEFSLNPEAAVSVRKNFSDRQLLEVHQLLMKTRMTDEHFRGLFRKARFAGTYFSAVGQEATCVCPTYLLKKEDFVGPSHREIGAAIAKGITLKEIAAQVYARKISGDKGKSHPCHYGSRELNVINPASTVASQAVLATGAALAYKIRKQDNIAITFFGEGATSRGGWHEALNFAGVHALPIVYVCQNNMWAESVPASLQAGIEHFADRAKAYGFPGITINGNDVMEVLAASRVAVNKAREGGGPTLIEMLTYRWYGHSEIDPANYRTAEELAEWKEKDTIRSFEKYLLDNKILTGERREGIVSEIETELREAIEFAESSPYADPEEALTDVYAEPFE
jgi:TPP-dependent pyruvate/acetoin dehydrogenase alpha subunit